MFKSGYSGLDFIQPLLGFTPLGRFASLPVQKGLLGLFVNQSAWFHLTQPILLKKNSPLAWRGLFLFFRKIGCGYWTTSEPRQPHDIIGISNLTKQTISRKARELYRKGFSLIAVADEIGASKSGIRRALIEAGEPLRGHSNSQISGCTKTKVMSVKTAPYGFCLVGGQLMEDPKEIANVHLMLKWWQQGMSLGAIARKLNSKNVKPRKAMAWSQPTIGFIIQRHVNKTEVK
jgi:hypothetical protein